MKGIKPANLGMRVISSLPPFLEGGLRSKAKVVLYPLEAERLHYAADGRERYFNITMLSRALCVPCDRALFCVTAKDPERKRKRIWKRSFLKQIAGMGEMESERRFLVLALADVEAPPSVVVLVFGGAKERIHTETIVHQHRAPGKCGSQLGLEKELLLVTF